MSNSRVMDGIFAVHKPADISSAQVLRDLQHHFNRSQFFKPWIEEERERIRQNNINQRRFRKKEKWVNVKLGHGGTLDPIATGVLITAIGKGTKRLSDFLSCTKTYEAVVLFGVATDSYDRVGKIVSRAPYDHVTREGVEAALAKFRGKIKQRPSIFSALKVQGKKLYEYAREGIKPPVEILERPVEVSNLEVVEWYDRGEHEFTWPEEEAEGEEKAIAKVMLEGDGTTESSTGLLEDFTDQKETIPEKRKSSPSGDIEPAQKRQKQEPDIQPKATKEPSTSTAGPPAAKLTMTVSSGFYVRSLAHDLGIALGSNAIMSSLVRTRQGDFELSPDKVLEYSDLEAGEEVWAPKLQGFLDQWREKDEKRNNSTVGDNEVS